MKLLEYIAYQTRRWAEKNNNHFPDSLCGMCGVASGELFRRLKKRGFNPLIVINKHGNHCYVKCNNKFIDVTATQFGKKYKHIEIFDLPHDKTIWTDGLVFNNLEEFNEAQASWPREQQFASYRKQI